jgi:hypothetical protein
MVASAHPNNKRKLTPALKPLLSLSTHAEMKAQSFSKEYKTSSWLEESKKLGITFHWDIRAGGVPVSSSSHDMVVPPLWILDHFHLSQQFML